MIGVQKNMIKEENRAQGMGKNGVTWLLPRTLSLRRIRKVETCFPEFISPILTLILVRDKLLT